MVVKKATMGSEAKKKQARQKAKALKQAQARGEKAVKAAKKKYRPSQIGKGAVRGAALRRQAESFKKK
jgi:hypothetical protein